MLLGLLLLAETVATGGSSSHGHKNRAQVTSSQLGAANFVPTPEQPVGFCGDGNAWFPGAVPGVVEGWDGMPGWGKVVHRGGMGNQSPPFDESSYKEQEMRVLLDRVPKNILWKVPVPGWGDSQPIVVGRTIINCYWPHFIVCYDAGTGKELWRDELEAFLLPQLRSDRKTIGPAPDPQKARNLQALFELGHAMRHLSHNLRDFEGDNPGETEIPLVKKAIERMGEWRRVLEEVYPEAVSELDFDIDLARRFVAGEYLILGLGAERLKKDRNALKKTPQFGQDPKRGLVKFAAKTCGTNIDNAWPGWMSFQTSSPASDGKVVVVRFANGQVGAYEVATGKRLWAWRDPKVNGGWTWHAASPRIGREVVVLDAVWTRKKEPEAEGPGMLGIEKRTGAIRWFHPYKANSGYPSSTPLLLDLGDNPPVVIGAMDGAILRQADGKVLGKLEVDQTAESYTLHRGNLVIANVKNKSKPGTRCFRLDAVSSDEVQVSTVCDLSAIRLHRFPTAMSDTFMYGEGGMYDVRSMQPIGNCFSGGHKSAPTIAGPYCISLPSMSANYGDAKYRPRRDGMCLQSFEIAEIPRSKGSGPVLMSNRSLLGGTEAPADLFFDKYLAGFDKMRQINPKKWCGRYGAHMAAWFGHRMGGVVPHGERLYIQSQCFLYCIGPAVKGTPKDDPKIVAAIRGAKNVNAVVKLLESKSAQYRYEAVKKCSVFSVQYSDGKSSELNALLRRLALEDPYEEIRAASVLALDACDPKGRAGWDLLVAEMPKGHAAPPPVFASREATERRQRLALTFRALGEQGPVLLEQRWAEASQDPLQTRVVIHLATRWGWRVESLVKTGLEVAQGGPAAKTPTWRTQVPNNTENSRVLPGYFAAIDAAVDPAVAEILLKAYPRDWTLYPTFARHVAAQRLLSWIEPIAMASSHPTHRSRIFMAWQAIGADAIPSMERVAARMAADEKNKLAPSFAKAIHEAIAAMKSE